MFCAVKAVGCALCPIRVQSPETGKRLARLQGEVEKCCGELHPNQLHLTGVSVTKRVKDQMQKHSSSNRDRGGFGEAGLR